MRNARHVVPHRDGWAVLKPDSERAISIHGSRSEAMERAHEILRNEGGGERITHGEDGRMREVDTVEGRGGEEFRPRAESTGDGLATPQGTGPAGAHGGVRVGRAKAGKRHREGSRGQEKAGARRRQAAGGNVPGRDAGARRRQGA